MKYRIRYAAPVLEEIQKQVEWIAEQSGYPDRAIAWAERLYDVIDDLETMPRRFSLAPENEHYAIEIRRLIFGDYIILYTIDDDLRLVRILSFRHGARKPLWE